MTVTANGDLARSLMLRRITGDLKTALIRHSEELTTGRAAQPLKSLRGDVGAFAALERSRTGLEAFRTATAEAALFAEGQQRILARLIGDAQTALPAMLMVDTWSPAPAIDNAARAGRDGFFAAVAGLNTSVAGRALFAGTATDAAALAPAADLLAELAAATAGIDTAEALEEAVLAWFHTPGGGFDSLGYRGAPEAPGPVAIAPGESVPLGVTAAEPETREFLAALALAALVDDGALSGDRAARGDAVARAGRRLFSAEGGLVALAAGIGTIEARIDAAATRNAAEAAALDLALGDLVGVDPFEAAARLEDTRARLETVFTITARLQRLTLTEYLR